MLRGDPLIGEGALPLDAALLMQGTTNLVDVPISRASETAGDKLYGGILAYSPHGWLIVEFRRKYTEHRRLCFALYSCMALGRLWEAAKYSHGLWEQFADTAGQFHMF